MHAPLLGRTARKPPGEEGPQRQSKRSSSPNAGTGHQRHTQHSKDARFMHAKPTTMKAGAPRCSVAPCVHGRRHRLRPTEQGHHHRNEDNALGHHASERPSRSEIRSTCPLGARNRLPFIGHLRNEAQCQGERRRHVIDGHAQCGKGRQKAREGLRRLFRARRENEGERCEQDEEYTRSEKEGTDAAHAQCGKGRQKAREGLRRLFRARRENEGERCEQDEEYTRSEKEGTDAALGKKRQRADDDKRRRSRGDPRRRRGKRSGRYGNVERKGVEQHDDSQHHPDGDRKLRHSSDRGARDGKGEHDD